MRWLPIALFTVVLAGAGCVPVTSPTDSEPSEETAVQVSEDESAASVVRQASRPEPFLPPLIGTLEMREFRVRVYVGEELLYTLHQRRHSALKTGPWQRSVENAFS